MQNWKCIAAMASNGVIGINDQLPWHLPEDLKWFKKCTIGQVVVMGRKTFSYFGSRPLPKRQTIVISRQKPALPEGVLLINSIDELKAYKTDKEIWICGGREIYEQTLVNCSDLYQTLIKKEYKGDTSFPDFSAYFKDYEVIRDEETFQIRHYKRS